MDLEFERGKAKVELGPNEELFIKRGDPKGGACNITSSEVKTKSWGFQFPEPTSGVGELPPYDEDFLERVLRGVEAEDPRFPEISILAGMIRWFVENLDRSDLNVMGGEGWRDRFGAIRRGEAFGSDR